MNDERWVFSDSWRDRSSGDCEKKTESEGGRSDILRYSVPHTRISNRRSSVNNGWETRMHRRNQDQKFGEGQKWTSETFLVYLLFILIFLIFYLFIMVLKSMDYVCKMCIFKKLSIVLYSVHWCMYYVHIKKLSLRVALVANRSITASMLGVSDRWICCIIRHSRRFFFTEALSAV